MRLIVYKMKSFLITRVLHGDVLNLVASVEQIHYTGAVVNVEMSEIVQMVVRVQYQRMGVVRPQVDENILQHYALQQQFLLVLLVRAEVVLLEERALGRERQRLVVYVYDDSIEKQERQGESEWRNEMVKETRLT